MGPWGLGKFYSSLAGTFWPWETWDSGLAYSCHLCRQLSSRAPKVPKAGRTPCLKRQDTYHRGKDVFLILFL